MQIYMYVTVQIYLFIYLFFGTLSVSSYPSEALKKKIPSINTQVSRFRQKCLLHDLYNSVCTHASPPHHCYEVTL